MSFLKYFISLLLLFVFLFTRTYSTTFYVNSAKGVDTLAEFDGSSSEKAFKTIQHAVDIANEGDKIIIEGKTSSNNLTYHESVKINKPSIWIEGIDLPVLDGSINEKNHLINGIEINADFVRIEGIVIKNYISDSTNRFGFKGGTGISSASGMQKVQIINNKIENCNWGIFLFENILSEIYANEIKNIPGFTLMSGNTVDAAGVGIMLWSNGKSMTALEIGTNGGNRIDSAQFTGIFYGNTNKEILGEYSNFIGNQITKTDKGPAIAFYNVTGIIKVTTNIFENNFSSLLIKGLMLDIWYGGNFFNGSNGKTEIMVSESYPGELLFAFWKDNENSFSKPTFAALNKEKMAIISIDGNRYIRNDESEAKKDAGEKGVVLKLEPAKK